MSTSKLPNSGFKQVDDTEFYALYHDFRLVESITESITAAEAVRIAAEMRAKYPPGLSSVFIHTFAPGSATGRSWSNVLTTITVTPDQMPERIARCHDQGEHVMALMMHSSGYTCLKVLKGQDDWWWALYAGKTTRRCFRCDQLYGLLALINHLAGE